MIRPTRLLVDDERLMVTPLPSHPHGVRPIMHAEPGAGLQQTFPCHHVVTVRAHMSLPPMEGARACPHYPCHHALYRTPRCLAGGDDRAGRGPAVPPGAGRMGLVVRIVPPRQADRDRGALLHVLPDGGPSHLAARHRRRGDAPADAAGGSSSALTTGGPMSTPRAASSTCRGPPPAASASNTPASRPCGSW